MANEQLSASPTAGRTAALYLRLALAAAFLSAAAAASGILLLGFALGMVLGDGVKAPLDASVFTASAGAFLLYVHPDSLWSLDRARRRATHPPRTPDPRP